MILAPENSLIDKRYRLRRKLGEGGMGTVYHATDRLTGRDIALKRVVLLDPTLDDELDRMRLALTEEFRLLASLHHPHVISVLDYGFDSERKPYFTMDLLTNPKPLTVAGVDQPLDVQIKLIIQTLQALAYLHRRGVVHRDLKPENVLVSEGQVKVLDFGLSKVTGVETSRGKRSELVGTLAYLAPEVLQHEQSSPAADLYAVGVMAYEMLVGEHPFDLGDVRKFVMSVLKNYPDLSRLPSTIENQGLTLDVAANSLAPVIGRLLAKDPSERYVDAQAAIADLSATINHPVVEESRAIRESFLQAAKFVGRSAEVEQLTSALDNAMIGRGSAWLIAGESGVGKSRLLDELRTVTLVSGAAVLRGQGVNSGAQPYHLWRDPVRWLALDAEMSDLEAGILRDIVPDIEQLLERAIPDPPQLETNARQTRLVTTIVELFRRQRQPLLLLVEDLHWMEESLSVLTMLAQHVAELPLLIVGTYRPDERADLPKQFEMMQHVTLKRLEAEHIAELSASMLGAMGEHPDVVRFLQRETEGNVFFLVEVVRALAEEAGGLREVGMRTLPEQIFAGGVEAAVRRRLNRIPENARPLLRLAAVAGRQLDFPVLRHLIDKQPELLPTTLDDWLALVANVAVLETQDGVWRFAHDKLREGVLSDLSAEERPRLNRQLAEAFEVVYPHDPSRAITLMEYWQAAGDRAKEFHYAQAAAKNALLVTSHAEAARLAQRALELLNPSDSDAATDQIMLLNLLGDARVELAHYDRALTSFEKSLTLARAQGDRAAMCQALSGIGLAYWGKSLYRDAKTYLEGSLTIARALGNRAEIARALNHLGYVHYFLGNYEKARQTREESLRLCHEIGDVEREASVLNGLGVVAKEMGAYAEAQAYHEASLQLKDRIGDRKTMSQSYTNLAVLAYEQGDYLLARDLLRQSLALDVEVASARGMCIDHINLGMVALALDEYDTALDHYQTCLRLSQDSSNTHNIIDALFGLAGAIIGAGLKSVGRPERAEAAAQLLGASEHHLKRLGYMPASEDRAIFDRVSTAIQASLDAETYQRLHRAGAGMSIEEAVAFGLAYTI